MPIGPGRMDRSVSPCDARHVGVEPDPEELVSLHLESLYRVDPQGRLRAINDGGGLRPPRLVMVLAAGGHRWLVRDDLDPALVARLADVIALEPRSGSLRREPEQRDSLVALLESVEPVRRTFCGPAYVLPPTAADPSGRARVLGEADRGALEVHFQGWAQDFEASRPLAAVIESGVAVSVCGCARRRTRAVEAGVETAEAWRSRGFARAATAAWATALRELGSVPLYSTEWSNVASQRVALALGARQYAVDFSVT